MMFLLQRVRNKSTEKNPGSSWDSNPRPNASQMPLRPLAEGQKTSETGIWLRSLGNSAYVACLPLLCQGSEWLNGKSV